MGLTRIRAEQISDIDYKQAVRVISLENVTLTGGAPAEVDGVSLGTGNRILVAGQDDAAQNGLYVVQTVGAGSNGTWIRSQDGNQQGEITAGMIVMVTEGGVFKDTQWKLITNDPIVLDVSDLIFEQNSAFAFGNIFANGTAVLANTVGDTVTFTAGENISITGNAAAKSVTFAVTGISLNSISNGTSNVTVVSSGGNVTVGVAGSEVAEFSADGLAVTGNILGNGAGLTGINVFSNVSIQDGNSIIADSISDTLTLIAGSGIALIGNAAADTITIATVGSGDSIFATGGSMGTVDESVTASEDLGEVDQAVTEEYNLGSIGVDGVVTNDKIVDGTITGEKFASDINITTTGNITSGNLLPAANVTYDLGTDTARWNDLYLANSTIYLGNAQISANATSLILTNPEGAQTVFSGSVANIIASTVTATGNITGGNLITTGRLDATGNVTGGNLQVSGNVGIGTANTSAPLTLAYTAGTPNANLLTTDAAIITANATAPGLAFVVAGTTSGHRGVFKGTRSRGTLESPLVPQANDAVVTLLGAIYDGTTTRATAGIELTVDGSVSSGVAPQRIAMLTGNTNTRLERLSIYGNGVVNVQTTTDSTSSTTGALTVSGGIGAAGNLNVGGNVAAGNIEITGNISANNFILVGTQASSALQNNNDITGWYWTGNSFNVTSQETAPTGIFFKTDGTKMYIVGTTGDDITEYDLGTAWDITTATFVDQSASLGDTAPADLYITADGATCYVICDGADTVRQFSFGTPWAANTLSFVQSFSVSAQETSPSGITFRPDLTEMFICGSSGDGVDVYALSEAGNIATATFSYFTSLAAQDTAPQSIQFNSDGTRLYMLGSTGDDINRYDLPAPYDVANAVFFNNSFYWGFIEATPNGLFINFDVNRAWIVGSSSDQVREIETRGDGMRATGDSNYFDGFVYVGRDFDVRGNAVIETTFNVLGSTNLGTTTISGTATLSTTTGGVNLGTSQTTGIVTVGGTTATGNIVIGRSTANQLIDIGTGATTNGNTKTINIGTAAVLGNTAITIGPSANATVKIPVAYNTIVGGTNRDLFVDDTGLVGYVSSTRESKGNIQPLADIDWLHDLDAVSFNRRLRDDDGNYVDQCHQALEYGLIAEDVAKINTELVFYDDNDGNRKLAGVHYHKLIVPLLKQIQIQQQQIAALMSEIDSIKTVLKDDVGD
jgi:hypothetical protein